MNMRNENISNLSFFERGNDYPVILSLNILLGQGE